MGRKRKAIRSKRRLLCDKGILNHQFVIENGYKFKIKNKWTDEENQNLIQQVNAALSLREIQIEGRTKIAISRQRELLGKKGLCKYKRYKPRKGWTTKDIRKLRELTIWDNLNAPEIFKLKIFPNRSIQGITKQIARQDFGNPKTTNRAKSAKLNSPEKRKEIKRFLKNEGYSMHSVIAAAHLGITAPLLRDYRRRLKISKPPRVYLTKLQKLAMMTEKGEKLHE